MWGMAAVPVEYEAFLSLRRKLVTLVCFMLAASMAMGISVYVDSYSIYEWDELTNVGPMAMRINWYGIELGTSSVEGIAGVERVARMQFWDAELWRIGNAGWELYAWGQIVVLNEHLNETFPELCELESGRLPAGDNEVALDTRVAEELEAAVGTHVNMTFGYTDEGPIVHELEVVGILEQWGGYTSYYRTALVSTSSLPEDAGEQMIIDVDRTRITAFDAGGSIAYLNSIAEQIRSLDPLYDPQSPWSGRIYVDNILGWAVQGYVYYRLSMKVNQFVRAGGVMLLVVLVMFLAIRHNINERRYEASMLASRGAPSSMINNAILREMVVTSFAACFLGLALGIVVSRIGLAATGFLEFDFTRLWTEPFLVSTDSLAMSAVVGFLFPLLTYGLYKGAYSTKRRFTGTEGKLAKVARLMKLIHWDLLVVILSVLVLVVVQSLWGQLRTNYIIAPFLELFLTMTPLALFLGVSSLFVKVLRGISNRISNVFVRVVGPVPAFVGIRRIGKEASSAAPVAMVLVLAISLTWSSAALSASLPVTKLDQARFAFGGDVKFIAPTLNVSTYGEFLANVSSNPQVEAAADLAITYTYLAAHSYQYANLVAMNPTEFRQVGYDYLGLPLNESSLSSYLEQMIAVPGGAVITSDIATDYEMAVGDVLRVFPDVGNVSQILSFTVLGIADALPNAAYTDTGSVPTYMPYYGGPIVGGLTIWTNQAYVSGLVDIVRYFSHVVCVRTRAGANSTQVGVDISRQAGPTLIQWYSAQAEVTQYTGQTSFLINESVDNLLTVGTILTIFGAFSVYVAEGLQSRKREIALVRALGADTRLVASAQAAEMLVLSLVSLLLLALMAPVFMVNAILTYRTSYYVFPTPAHLVLPWVLMGSILALFLVSVAVFVIVVASLASRVNVAAALNAAWAESAPYGGET